MEKKELQTGKIYFVAFGENTQLVFRHRDSATTCEHYIAALHYWNGFETFKKDGYFFHSGITELRSATKPEKHNLLKHEIENGTI